MSNLLTSFEKRIIEAIWKQHPDFLNFKEIDLAKLEVLRREPTGVGVYVMFSRNNQLSKNVGMGAQLGFEGEICVHGVPSGLGAVLLIIDGQLNQLELFTYGSEYWDGNTEEGDIR
jgi:hypothetical protein